jgi:hypothetical protein
MSRHDLATLVAGEISEAFEAYDGRKWRQTKDGEKAVNFPIESKTLKGQNARTLNGAYGPRGYDSFDAAVYGIRIDNASSQPRVLHGVQFDLEIVDGLYTGKVIVRDGRGGWDSDL